MTKIKLTLEVTDVNSKQKYDSIVHDLFDGGRANIKVSHSGNKLVFEINSEDFTSIRASVNALLLKLRMLSELDQKLQIS